MKKDVSWIILGLIGVSILCYGFYVITTATHKPGCVCSYQECVSSHKETTQRYYGKSWHTEEVEDCDEYETVEYECDCVTYHLFGKDVKL